MKKAVPASLYIAIVFILLMLVEIPVAHAQNSGYVITLQEAIDKARTQNKWIAISKENEKAGVEDFKNARSEILPQWNAAAGYDRFTKLTLFENGLTDAQSMTRRPDANSASAGTEASFNVFSGGRQQSLIEAERVKMKLDVINTRDQEGSIVLQVVFQYMDMVRLHKLDSLINEQMKRAELRLKNIQSLYDNQRVTKSDLLRAQVILSNNKLNKEQAENDLSIVNQKLDVLLNIPDSIVLVPVDIADVALLDEGKEIDDIMKEESSPYPLQRFEKNIALQETRIKTIKSNYYPSLKLNAAYGLNYPNYLFNPPVAQWYAIGFVGVKIQYSISSLYHNRHKVSAAKLRLENLQLQKQAVADNINNEISIYRVKHKESLSRVKVAEESIEQAATNLKIVNTKYLNQLALLTDLLDADNLYLESTYNLVKARTDERIYYYRLLYTRGQL